MFVRPARAAARPVERPPGAPLLRGLLVGGPRPAKPAPAPPGAPDGGAVVDLLARLGELARQGVLTDEEFAAAKARLLGL